jgi:hypothetical protein
MEFKPWHSIEGFHNVLKDRSKNEWMKTCGIVNYTAKVKLHGTNAAIRIHAGEVKFQKRTEFCTIEHDNYGFAQWAESNIKMRSHSDADITIFGEWCGPGVQSGVAISQIPEKIFAIFAVLIDDEFIGNPDDIEALLWGGSFKTPEPLLEFNPRIRIIPTIGHYVVNLNDQNSIADFVEQVNQLVLDCEKIDPWVKDAFGIEGPGEGFVFYPTNINSARFMFKAKGEAHRVNKQKTAVQVDPDVLRSQQEFADKFITEPRCLQGVQEACGGEYDVKLTGPFLKWVMGDILKESKEEVLASDIEWKQLSSLCARTARSWYIQRT